MISLQTLLEPKYKKTKEFPETFNDNLGNAQGIKWFDSSRDRIASALIYVQCFKVEDYLT